MQITSHLNKLNSGARPAPLYTLEGQTLKVTINSSEPLSDTIRVIGALYNVTLTQATESTNAREHITVSRASARSSRKPAPPAGKQPQRSPAHKSLPATATTVRRSSATKTAAAADIRAWAMANGQTVNDRGPLPGTVKAAYAAAQPR